MQENEADSLTSLSPRQNSLRICEFGCVLSYYVLFVFHLGEKGSKARTHSYLVARRPEIAARISEQLAGDSMPSKRDHVEAECQQDEDNSGAAMPITI